MRYIKIDPDVPDLKRGTPNSAGVDLYNCDNAFTIHPGKNAIFNTGIKVEIPEGYFGLCTIRSGLGFKYGVSSHIGIIDSDYRGAMRVKIFNAGEAITIDKYERICQLVIVPYDMSEPELVDSLEESERGENGYGSTGRK